MTDASALTTHLERAAHAPALHAQLATQIRKAIEEHRLPPATRLPSTRALAQQLEVSRTVTSEAYATLLAEGYLESKRGSGTYVVERTEARPATTQATSESRSRRRWLPREIEQAHVDPPADPNVPFRICEPDARHFPDRAWRTSARAAINEEIPEGYPPPAGDGALRRAIAAFLLRERGLHVGADEILVTSGTTQSLDLIARTVLSPGDAVAFEDPGYRLARQIFTDRQAVIRPIPVDAEGLDVERLTSSDGSTHGLPVAVYLTPSHQFPMGGALSYRRRLDLLEWAARHDVLLIEDDYDSEFRFDGPILPSLLSADRSGTVAYLGTFSKSLSPRLRLGYVIAPPALRDAMMRLKVRSDQGSSWLTQRSAARYLQSGAFTRHLRRMRRLYRRRRDALIQAMAPLNAGQAWSGLAAGLHATLLLPEEMPADRFLEPCRDRGVVLATIESYQVGPERHNGLVLGYGASPRPEIEAAAEVIRQVMAR